MKKIKKQKIVRSEEAELLRSLIIIELAKAGLSQKEILKVVKGDIYRVNKIAKYFKTKGKR